MCRLVNDVRTRYHNNDPQLLKLIKDIEVIEKMVSDEDINRAA